MQRYSIINDQASHTAMSISPAGDWVLASEANSAVERERTKVVQLVLALETIRSKSSQAGYDGGDSGIFALADAACKVAQ